jgi:anaerobic selenocysteine-containing dehydrogenase
MVAHDLFRHRANIPITAFYKFADIYRGMSHRHTILMNPADIANGGLAAHQRVKVQGEAGALEGIEVIPGSIHCGAALMFYPEANVLMRAEFDTESGTPAFKRVPVPVRG